jgi:hypothetical protein
VNSHREQIIELDKTGTHLKYFSQKQDVVLIKNLLISVQSRWEKVVQRLVERGRSLDEARKRAKQVTNSAAVPQPWQPVSWSCGVMRSQGSHCRIGTIRSHGVLFLKGLWPAFALLCLGSQVRARGLILKSYK